MQNIVTYLCIQVIPFSFAFYASNTEHYILFNNQNFLHSMYSKLWLLRVLHVWENNYNNNSNNKRNIKVWNRWNYHYTLCYYFCTWIKISAKLFHSKDLASQYSSLTYKIINVLIKSATVSLMENQIKRRSCNDIECWAQKFYY